MTGTNERQSIRRLMRKRRRQLTAAEQRNAALRLRNHLLSLPRFRHARSIAAYLAVDSEISLEPVIETAWSLGIPVYLPCLRGEHMEFRLYTPQTGLILNRFGIPEPEARAPSINVRFIETVLAPLVAFDDKGGRLGTGGGYYDRTFAYLRLRNCWKRPSLFGVAHEFQRMEDLPLARWDVAMNGVITDSRCRFFGIQGEH